MAEHDDETRTDETRTDETQVDQQLSEDELLREANRLRYGPVLPDRTVVLPTMDPAFDEPIETGPLLRDPGALLIGTWFAVAGLVAALVGESRLDDVPPVIVPISFAVVGLGLLLPKRRARQSVRR